MKEVEFLGDSLERIRAFPDDARREAGFQLKSVQAGSEPSDWKPFPDIGMGVREIRISEASGAFRVVYVTNIGDCVYVLHAFQKKTQKTSKHDIEIARKRFKEIKR